VNSRPGQWRTALDGGSDLLGREAASADLAQEPGAYEPSGTHNRRLGVSHFLRYEKAPNRPTRRLATLQSS
jgi:hypothetical protein